VIVPVLISAGAEIQTGILHFSRGEMSKYISSLGFQFQSNCYGIQLTVFIIDFSPAGSATYSTKLGCNLSCPDITRLRVHFRVISFQFTTFAFE
jgi:hypothetical protein